jgi:phage terminase Nu1 subunit (DNA packaging protein)
MRKHRGATVALAVAVLAVVAVGAQWSCGRIEARRDILSMPVYQAFMFLTVKRSAEDKAKTAAERAKGNTKSLDPSNDSLLTAIAKLGGLQRESAGQLLGVHADHFNHQSGVFGKPVFRANGGLTADAMGEALAEAGYLLPSETGRYDLRELEDLIDAELRGSPQYSIAKQYGEEARTGEGTDLAELRAGRFDFGDLHTLGLPEGSIAKLEQLGMTLKEGGIHPDIVADGFGFENGQDLVAALLAAESPLTAVEGKTDQLMLQRHGDLVDQRALEAAALQAVHNQARAKSLATELKAQADALGARTDTGEVTARGSKITVSSLMQAGKRFAADVVARTTIQDLERTARKHTAAERRAGQRWQEATAKGDTAASWLAAYCERLRDQAAGRLGETYGLDLVQERAALAREQREGQAIKNAIARGEYAPIGLLGDVLATASSSVVDRLDGLEGLLRKTAPDLPEEARSAILNALAGARNEWVRATSRLVVEQLDAMDDDDGEEPVEP